MLLPLTKRLKGQLHLFIPRKRQSLEFLLLVERKHLDQDPLGLESANSGVNKKTTCYLMCCHYVLYHHNILFSLNYVT